jgi:hypothetical protein
MLKRNIHGLFVTLVMLLVAGCGSVEISRGTFDGDAARDPINALLPGQLPDEADELYYSFDEGQTMAVMILRLPAAQVDDFLAQNNYCVGLPLEENTDMGLASGQCTEDGTIYSITVDRTNPDVHVVQYGLIYEQR